MLFSHIIVHAVYIERDNTLAGWGGEGREYPLLIYVGWLLPTSTTYYRVAVADPGDYK